jgi:phosphatidylethanolamine/phosphatidyl-N-methylethanolamine N-methyltransferase
VRNLLAWFGALRRNPRQMGGLLPAGRSLAQAMAREAVRGRNERWLVEIGPGTGNITAELLRLTRGRMKLRAVEADVSLAAKLRHRLPAIEVVAGRFEEVEERVFAGVDRAVVVSSVPIFSLRRDRRSAFFRALTKAVRRGRVSLCVQYTFWPVLPWIEARRLCGTYPLRVAPNLPPAWIWSRDHSGPADAGRN